MISLLLIALALVSSARCGGLADDIYMSFDVAEGAACYRILNGTHEFGCQTSEDDSKGVVMIVNSTSDFKSMRSCWRERFQHYSGNYFVMIDVRLLNSDAISILRDSSCVRGLLLTDLFPDVDVTDSTAGSHDSKCPNAYSSFYGDGCNANKWNEKGAIVAEGLRNINWNLQIVFLYDRKEIETVAKCYTMFNVAGAEHYVNFPLCAASFRLFSNAAGNSEICARRSKPSSFPELNIDGNVAVCNELTDKSIIAIVPPKPWSSAAGPDKYLILSTRMDSFGFIPEVSPSEISSVTSVVAMLAVARSVGVHWDAFEKASNKSQRHVIFSYFSMEAFDYVGSSSVFYEMAEGKFPVNLEDYTRMNPKPNPIGLKDVFAVIEPQHIGSGKHLHAVVDGDQLMHMKQEIAPIVKWLSSGAKAQNGSIGSPAGGGRMPPSTWHPLNNAKKGIPGVVIAPFENEYHYTRVNSMLDHNRWTEAAKLKKLNEDIGVAASAMLHAAANFIQLDQDLISTLQIDSKWIEDLVQCLVVSSNWTSCDLISTVSDGQKELDYFYPGKSTYSSVFRNKLVNPVYWFMVYAMGQTTHTSNIKTKEECNELTKTQNLWAYIWQADPYTKQKHCYKVSTFIDHAVSPAFRIKDYDFSSGRYSTWTESVYSVDQLRLYLLQSTDVQWLVLILGTISIALSFMVIWRCSEKTFIIDEGELSAERGEPL